MPTARLTDPHTSHEAAASVRNITQTQTAILLLLLSSPSTDEELIRQYQNDSPLVCPPASESGIRSRRAELVRMGKVIDTGRRAKLTSGRNAIVWGAAV